MFKGMLQGRVVERVRERVCVFVCVLLCVCVRVCVFTKRECGKSANNNNKAPTAVKYVVIVVFPVLSKA